MKKKKLSREEFEHKYWKELGVNSKNNRCKGLGK